MIYSKYRLTLDIKKTKSQLSIPVLLHDTCWGFLIDLVDDGKPFEINHGNRAVFVSKRPDGSTYANDCIIEGLNTVRYDFTAKTTSVEGVHNCEIRIYGANGRLLTCPSFTLVVDRRVVLDGDIDVPDEQRDLIDDIIFSEEGRLEAENARVEAENARFEAENARVEAENARFEAENARVEAENARSEAISKLEQDTEEQEKAIAKNDARLKAIEGAIDPESLNFDWRIVDTYGGVGDFTPTFNKEWITLAKRVSVDVVLTNNVLITKLPPKTRILFRNNELPTDLKMSGGNGKIVSAQEILSNGGYYTFDLEEGLLAIAFTAQLDKGQEFEITFALYAEQDTEELQESVKELQEAAEKLKGNGENSVILNNPNSNTADGDNSIVGGTNCHANYQDSISFGRNCSANNNGAFGFGYECHSNAKYSWSSGHYCETSSDAMAAHSFGQGLKANRIGQLLGGRYNKPNAKAAFILGFGKSDTDRRNGLEVVIENNVISLVLDGVAISSDELRTLIDNLSNIKKIAKLEERVAALESGSGVTLITFTINGSEYTAEEGMTLKEWCDSEYNTGGYVAPNDGEYVSEMITMWNGDGYPSQSTIIIEGSEFYTD